MKKNLKNIFYINTIYSLLIVLIWKPNTEENLYFFNEDFSENIMKNIRNKVILKKYKKLPKFFRAIKIRMFLKKIVKNYKVLLKNKVIFIQDNITFSQFFFNNFESSIFYLIEDGTINYNEKILSSTLKNKRKSFLYRYTYLAKRYYYSLGLSTKIKKIYLTGLLPVPKIIEEKVEILDIKKLWGNLSNEQKREILSIFNIKLEKVIELENLQNKILLITQPLSEDKILTEKEKIEIYKEIIEKEKEKIIYIKPHPREKTDYKKIFVKYNIEIIEKEFPIDLFSFLNVEFSKVITLFSTAALNFKDKYKVEFIGTKKYKKLYEKFGEIKINEEVSNAK